MNNLRPRKFKHRITNLSAIDLHWLRDVGIKGLIIDLDNTIVSEDDVYLSPRVEQWLKKAKQQGFKLFLLSNGKRRYRVQYWSTRLKIPALSPAHKPLPWSFYRAIATLKLSSRQVVVIGDSLHTDIIGAWLTRCSSIQVASLPHPPQWWEKLLGRWVQIPYPHHLELWRLNSSKPETDLATSNYLISRL